MLTIAIDCGDQLRNGHAALAGDLLQTVPELLFKAHARLVAALTNRALRNRRLHSFSPPQRRNRKRSFLNRCANNFNLWPEQHSQQQATQCNFWQPQRGSGENRCGSRGPLDLHPAVQGLSQSSPSRTSQIDPAQARYILPSIVNCDGRGNGQVIEYPHPGWRAYNRWNAAYADELGMGA